MARIIAIDYGTKRTGIAVTDELQLIASGLTTVATKDLFPFLKEYLVQEKVEAMVIGEPKRMSGEASDVEEEILRFRESVTKTFPSLTIIRQDERFTSKMAFQTMIDSGLSKKKRDQILKGWFSRHVRAELEFLVSLITELKGTDPLVIDALKICLSSVVVKASNQESDSQKTATTKHIGRGACARWFKSRVDLLCQGLNDLSQSPNQETDMFLANAADIKTLGLKKESVNVVCTSPPYLGTYDYVEHHDLRAALLGLPLEDFRVGELGSRRDFDKNGAKEFKASKQSMADVFQGIEELLVPGGLAIFVMGDSLAGGRYVLADEFLSEANDKLEKAAWAAQPRKKWGLKETQIFGSQVKKEHIVVFRKP